MRLFSWLKNWTGFDHSRGARRTGSGRKPTRQFRPQLEALEDRCVPSTLKVTNGLDDGRGSLRDALARASSSGNDSPRIVFANDVHTVNLGSRQLNVTVGVTIEGPGAGLLTLTTNYNFGDPWGQTTRVFEVNASKPVVISGLTISDNGGSSQGAAILNDSTLTVSGCTISNNRATDGGAIYNAGTLTLSGCTLSNDNAEGYGGGVYNAGTLTVSGCTLSHDQQGNLGSGGGIYSTGMLTVNQSTFVADDIFGSYTDGGGNTFIYDHPQIGSFTTSPSTVTAGSSLTLTVTNITDANPNSTITQVIYFGYTSATSGMTGDMGSFTQSSPGVWTFTLSTAGLAPGTYTFYALAVDNYGQDSVVSGPTVQVI